MHLHWIKILVALLPKGIAARPKINFQTGLQHFYLFTEADSFTAQALKVGTQVQVHPLYMVSAKGGYFMF